MWIERYRLLHFGFVWHSIRFCQRVRGCFVNLIQTGNCQHSVDYGNVTGATRREGAKTVGGRILHPRSVCGQEACKAPPSRPPARDAKEDSVLKLLGVFCLIHVNAAYHGAALKITILRLISPVVDQRYVEIIVKFNREDERWRKRCNGRRRGRDQP